MRKVSVESVEESKDDMTEWRQMVGGGQGISNGFNTARVEEHEDDESLSLGAQKIESIL